MKVGAISIFPVVYSSQPTHRSKAKISQQQFKRPPVWAFKEKGKGL